MPGFLVTGMFRSGTTMIARMLHTNPEIVCASDPFLPIFKAFRNHHALKLDKAYDPASPFHDYYFDDLQQKIYRSQAAGSFDAGVEGLSLQQLRQDIARHAQPYSPLILDHLGGLSGHTFKEIFDSGLHVLERAYGKDESIICGFKDVWVGEYAGQFLGMHDSNRVLHIIRDPRSIVASNLASGMVYPLLFLARQWRKLASLAWLDAQQYGGRVKIVRLEDLLSDPENTAMQICDFLGVQYSDFMIDPEQYQDGGGKPWRQNTSYESARQPADHEGRSFNKAAIEKWRTVLSDDIVRLFEALCHAEITMHGYEVSIAGSDVMGILQDSAYRDDDVSLADWIRPYANYDYSAELQHEIARVRLFLAADDISVDIKQHVALEVSLFDGIADIFRKASD